MNELQKYLAKCKESAPPVAVEAVELAKAGWHIFPCHETGDRAKSPYTRHGHKDATSDLEIVKSWWRQYPNALIGLALPPQLIVLDVDPRNGGSIEALEACVGKLPPTLTVLTGRGDGGQHFYFRRPGGDLTQTRLPKGVDLKKGGAGYVIAPPSLHPETGLPYVWSRITAAAELPERAKKVLQVQTARPMPARSQNRVSESRRDKRLIGVFDRLSSAVVGQRNDLFYWTACRLIELDGTEPEWETLVNIGTQIGLTDAEMTKTIKSARESLKTNA